MQSNVEARVNLRRGAKASAGAVALLTLALAGGGQRASADDFTSNAKRGGAVYSETNAVVGNAVVVFDRAADGRLTPYGTFFTGGRGTGSALNTQGEVILSPDSKLLFAVNAGSNEISVFTVQGRNLTLADTVSSGGVEPVSLTLHGDLLYVLNRKGVSNITGFKVGWDATLKPVRNSTQTLTTALPDAAQVSFTPDGKLLVVTEKATNMIDTFVLRKNGATIGPLAHPSSGQTPFGFSFGPRGEMIVSEAFGGAPNASALSLYLPKSNGALELITGSSPTHQTAACWSVTTGDGKYTYTSNTRSGTISGYYIGNKGSLTLLNADGVTGGVPDAAVTKPTDLALTPDSRYLYALQTGVGAVVGWRVEPNGSLTLTDVVTVLPLSSSGLIAR